MSSSFELRLLFDAPIGEVTELPSAGTPLEQLLVYDSAARALKALAADGTLEVVMERVERYTGQSLIAEFAFRRLR